MCLLTRCIRLWVCSSDGSLSLYPQQTVPMPMHATLKCSCSFRSSLSISSPKPIAMTKAFRYCCLVLLLRGQHGFERLEKCCTQNVRLAILDTERHWPVAATKRHSLQIRSSDSSLRVYSSTNPFNTDEQRLRLDLGCNPSRSVPL